MKKYYDDNICLNIELNKKDIIEAKKEYDLFKRNKSTLNRWCYIKHPTFRNFVEIYFGEQLDFGYDLPSKFICTNKNIANELTNFLKPLEYHDTYNQCGRQIIQEGKLVFIDNFDY